MIFWIEIFRPQLAVLRIVWSILPAAFAPFPSANAADSEIDRRTATDIQSAQFQLPPATGTPGETAPAPALPRQLKYEYTLGSESEASYRRNPDLDSNLSDNFAVVQPQANAFLTYRPTDWLETRFELILDREMLVHGNREVILPSGEIERRPDDRNSFLVDQAYFTIHRITDPFSFTAGRRNYEDERHWLYDTSLDVGAIGFRQGRWRLEASYGREVLTDLDALQRQPKDRVNTFMLYGESRALEDVKLAAYAIRRDDRDDRDGRWTLVGLRTLGYPVPSFSYWAELAAVHGRDENSRRIRGYGFDIGATYHFVGVPLSPNITVAYALGSGDEDPNDNASNDFRQSGLQSNEQKFAGLAEFKYYGEALDPELSNLEILTVDVGFRPIRDTSVDLVYHRYRLRAFAEELRNSALTAQMNQDPERTSYDVGSALDLVIGFRNVLGIQRLGIDLRGGWFFPGDAFRNDIGDDNFVRADSAAAIVVKIWL